MVMIADAIKALAVGDGARTGEHPSAPAVAGARWGPYVVRMTRQELAQRLVACGLLESADAESLQPLTGGRVAEHVCRFASSTDAAPLVVKELRPNEGVILRVLSHLASPLVPRIHCPQLLEEDLLVWDYVEQGTPRPLHPATARAYAQFQNASDDPRLFAEAGVADKVRLDRSGHAFYAEGFARCLDHARKNVERLNGTAMPGLPLVREVVELVDSQQGMLIPRFAHAPFAWLHHDFRDDNLVGYPQKLIDWGSSYGYGPYLFDIAPFLLESGDAMPAFAGESAIWRSCSPADQLADLTACAAAALMGSVHWHLGDLLNEGDVVGAAALLDRPTVQFGKLRDLLQVQAE
jgi:hypothetical protein